jgi:hypothetical protein
MRKPAFWRILVSPWMIPVFLVIGWGPAFVGDWVKVMRPDPDFDAEYIHYLMQWIVITELCSIIAFALILVHAFRFLYRLLGSPERRK